MKLFFCVSWHTYLFLSQQNTFVASTVIVSEDSSKWFKTSFVIHPLQFVNEKKLRWCDHTLKYFSWPKASWLFLLFSSYVPSHDNSSGFRHYSTAMIQLAKLKTNFVSYVCYSSLKQNQIPSFKALIIMLPYSLSCKSHNFHKTGKLHFTNCNTSSCSLVHCSTVLCQQKGWWESRSEKNLLQLTKHMVHILIKYALTLSGTHGVHFG